MDGGRPGQYLDQPGRPVLDAEGHSRHQPAAARRLDRRGHQDTGRLPGPGGSRKTSSGRQAVLWVSPDGVRWHRLTAAQLGLTEAGATPGNIDFATSRASVTVISDRGSGAWLSTDSGLRWSAVRIPVDHGARKAISGVSFDGSGLIAVRPGITASGARDGVAYFSPAGRAWQYAGTIDAAGGWAPAVVKGSRYGFVVTGTTSANRYVAYTSTGAGATWQPTGSLGDRSAGPDLTATLGPGGTVVAVGSQSRTATGQQAVFVTADRAGHVWPVSLARVPGGLIPELAVHGTAVAGGEQIAVGTADGFPAVWRRTASGSWALVFLLTPGIRRRGPGRAVRRDPRACLGGSRSGPVRLSSPRPAVPPGGPLQPSRGLWPRGRRRRGQARRQGT